MTGLRIREAARAVILDPDERILLARFEFPTRSLWTAPGGGLEEGESHEQALRRELAEEVGLADVRVAGELWTRLHIIPFLNGRWDGQRERYFLVRTPRFEPVPRLTWEELNAEYMFELRWWSHAELVAATVTFAPARLPELVATLLRDGPPPEPIDAGV